MLDEGLQFAFSEGKLLFFLLPLWVLLIYRLRGMRRRFSAGLGIGKNPRSQIHSWVFQALLPLTFFFATLALMQPFIFDDFEKGEGGRGSPVELSEEGDSPRKKIAHDVIFLVDASASMSVEDTRLGISRLAFAKEIIDETITKLSGQNVALYAFTSEVTTICPLTMDYVCFRLRNSFIAINEGDVAGTDLLFALDIVKKKHFAGKKEKPTTLVLLTDGGDTRIEQLKGEKREEEIQLLLGTLVNGKAPLTLFTIGLGTQGGKEIPGVEFEGSPVFSTLDEELLERLGEIGGGSYIYADEGSAWVIASQLVDAIKKRDGYEDAQGSRLGAAGVALKKKHYYQIPLVCALAAFLFLLTTPQTRKRRLLPLLLLCLAPLNGETEEMKAEVSKAFNYMELGKFEEAESIYKRLLSQELTPQEEKTLLFNLGTVKLLQEDFDGAFSFFEEIEKGEATKGVLAISWGYNFSLALLKKVEKLAEEKSASPEMLQMLEKALEHLLKGYDVQEKASYSILEPGQVNVFKTQAKQLYAKIRKKLLSAPFEQGEVYDIARDLSNRLYYLSLGLEKEEAARYLVEIKNLKFGWEILAQKGKDFDKEAKKRFEEAYHHYLSALERLEGGETGKGKEHLATSGEELLALRRALLEMLWKEDPSKALKESAENLQERLKKVKIGKEETNEAFARYEKELAEVSELFLENRSKLQDWERVQFEKLGLVSSLLKENQAGKEKELAKFYQRASQGYLSLLAQGLSNAETALQRGLAAEREALSMTKQAKKIPYDGDIHKEVVEAQGRVLELIQPFPEEHEKKEAFEAGKEEALAALDVLGQGGSELQKVSGHQQEAIRYWSEGESSANQQDQEEEQDNEQEEEESQSPFNQKESQLYEALEKEDRPEKEEEGIVKKGLRPW